MFHRSLLGAVLAAALSSTLFATDSVRVATYNVEALNFGSSGYQALIDSVKRLDADVILLEEITQSTDVNQMPSFAASCGYPFFFVGTAQGTLTGNLRNAVMSRYPFSFTKSWGADDISSDPTANDITRDIVEVDIQISDVCPKLGFFAVHLKSGSTSLDSFRRAVELLRVKKVIENWLVANPTGQVFLAGDFNDDINDAPFGNVYNSLPSGLPVTYDLGSDISFPVVYDPFNTVASIGGIQLTPVTATQEDCTSCFATRSSSGRRLDYIFARFSTLVLGDEVYASPKDNGTDESPIGNYLRKANATLPSTTSDDAADHYPVFADFLLNSCDGTRYGSAYPGQYNLSPRAGIKGIAKPGNAAFGMRVVYARPNSSAILVLGANKLNPPFGLSAAPYVPGATLFVDVITAYGFFVTATDAKGKSNFGLPIPNTPSLIGTPFEAQWFVTDPSGPNAVGSMSDAYSVTVHS